MALLMTFLTFLPFSPFPERLPGADASLLARGPVALPSDWMQLVNQPQTEAEVESIRTSIARGRPYGSDRWQQRAARDLELESTLRTRGRPRKGAKK